MEKVFIYITEVENQTNQQFEFEVESGLLQLRPLPSGKTRQIKLWKVLQCCRKHESPKWKIRFLIHNQFTGMELNALQLLSYTRIIIKFEKVGHELYLPCLDAIMERRIDYWLRLKYLGCLKNYFWNRRQCVRIARGVTKFRVVEAPHQQQLVVVPLTREDESLQQRQVIASSSGWQGRQKEGRRKLPTSTRNVPPDVVRPVKAIAATPPQQEIFTGWSSGVERRERGLGGGAHRPGEQQQLEDDNLQRLYSLPMFQNMDKTVRFLLLVVSFLSVCLLRMLF